MVTKREEKGHRLASLVASLIERTNSDKREDYYETVRTIVDTYKFYSSEDVRNHHGGIHPRSVKKIKPQLIKVDTFSAESIGKFVCNELEDGLVRPTSERSRRHFIEYLDKYMNELKEKV